MDLSYASAVGQQKNKGRNARRFRCGTMCHYAPECMAPETQAKVAVAILGIVTVKQKIKNGQVGAGRPTGNAVTRIYNGHAILKTAALSERKSHYTMQDDMSNLVILKVTSTTKRMDSLCVLVTRARRSTLFNSNICRCWTSRENMYLVLSELEVRLATGAIVKTEKGINRARFSYKHRMFVESLLVLAFDNKVDMVLVIPWLTRMIIIDWDKRTFLRFRRCSTFETVGPVNAADTPNSASEPLIETVARATVFGRRVWEKEIPGQGPDTAKEYFAVRRRGDNFRELTRTRYRNRENIPPRREDNGLSTPELRYTAPLYGVEVTTMNRLRESIRQAVWMVANVQH
ncbi:LOW QUALITY PROTEIN: hypothetical protein PHMEG_000844 [Phytophthora megakarya]|uniref:Reverse transcriptase n=1 Tax=Phytophthora megakarya TaxID=4795 RepID=A0A225X4I6_9STRA|nr:LOW QUALITY PROTEIN: hypothetical protein PHMEG_000844 [Phytophthora megakarya]